MEAADATLGARMLTWGADAAPFDGGGRCHTQVSKGRVPKGRVHFKAGFRKEVSLFWTYCYFQYSISGIVNFMRWRQ